MANDRDIKIYVSKRKENDSEFSNISDEIALHTANGNTEKAIALGHQLAKVLPEDGFLDLSGFKMTSPLLYQIRVLLTFLAEQAVDRNIKTDVLAQTTVSSMYEYLKTNESGYYDNISDGAAFTFYLLALKKGGDAAENIGEQFSKLCNIGWQEIIDLGKRIFIQSSEYYDKIIQEITFDEI